MFWKFLTQVQPTASDVVVVLPVTLRIGSPQFAPPGTCLQQQHPPFLFQPTHCKKSYNNNNNMTGQFEFLCLENPLLDIQGVGYVDFCFCSEVRGGNTIEMKERKD